jgi:hypothetical protein
MHKARKGIVGSGGGGAYLEVPACTKSNLFLREIIETQCT